jgi:ABC-type phosphate transport system substrate-binding protein
VNLPSLFLSALSVVLAGAAPALAADCAGLPSPVFVTGSTAAKPLLAAVGKLLASQSPPITVVYAGQGSCSGVDAVLNGTPLRGSGATALSYWDGVGVEQKCEAAGDGALPAADVGISDVFASTCFRLPGGLPSNVADFLGPVQTMTFVVPVASPETSISAEAAYYVYGFGAASGVEPWTSEAMILRRDELSGTQRMIAAAISVDAARWKGTATTGSEDLRKKLVASAMPTRSLGVLSTDVAQDNRANVRVLAYQHFGQGCGYFPDREEGSNEKANVRDGHYAIWGPLHLLTRLNGSGFPVKPAAAEVIGYLAGTKTAGDSLDLIALEARRHVVPQCAMRVKRATELGALASFAPPGSCGCYYDQVANNATTCTPCTGPRDCPAMAPVCSYGYCETQ